MVVRFHGMLLLSSKCPRPLRGRETPNERRFGEPLQGPTLPFGALVEYHPISTRDQMRLHQFWKKVVSGIFLGYAPTAGGSWKGDALIADLEELENVEASEKLSSTNQRKRIIDQTKKEMNSDSHLQMVQRNCQEETTNSENPL